MPTEYFSATEQFANALLQRATHILSVLACWRKVTNFCSIVNCYCFTRSCAWNRACGSICTGLTRFLFQKHEETLLCQITVFANVSPLKNSNDQEKIDFTLNEMKLLLKIATKLTWFTTLLYLRPLVRSGPRLDDALRIWKPMQESRRSLERPPHILQRK